MERIIPIGIKQFSEIRKDNTYCYVDKSDLIPRIIRSRAKVYLFTSSRRFGKSPNPSILDSFFNVEKKDDARYFEGLKVSENEESKKYQNR